MDSDLDDSLEILFQSMYFELCLRKGSQSGEFVFPWDLKSSERIPGISICIFHSELSPDAPREGLSDEAGQSAVGIAPAEEQASQVG